MIHSEGGMVRRGDQKVLVAGAKGKDAKYSCNSSN